MSNYKKKSIQPCSANENTQCALISQIRELEQQLDCIVEPEYPDNLLNNANPTVSWRFNHMYSILLQKPVDEQQLTQMIQTLSNILKYQQTIDEQKEQRNLINKQIADIKLQLGIK